jgi:tetratricopeptide (TPR) repeat protein
MKLFLTYILLFSVSISFSQEKALEKITTKANDLVYKANDLLTGEDYVSAEMEYRKALSQQPNNVAGTYNLGHSYYKKGKYEEALFRNQQAVKSAQTKSEKHKAFHNIGNILMQNKKYKEAVEAYKNALRNNPKDEETRYNLALAKELAKQQEEQDKKDNKDDKNKDKEKDKDKDKKDDKKDKGDDNKDKDKDKGDDDKKEGDDKKDEEKKPEDDKKEDGDNKDKGDKKKEEPKKPQQQPGQLSPQQIKSLLEAMNNEEQKVQDKMNAKKAKGVKIQTDKDW